MPDDTSGPSSPTVQRPKPARSQTTGIVRARASSITGSEEQNGDVRPQKRARKAINCQPCRNSKLKCDRNRPCSSCVLRGTSAMCYRDSGGPEGGDPLVRGDDHHYPRVDPAQEFARLRHSINQLEAYVFQRDPIRSYQPQRRPSEASNLVPKKEPVDVEIAEKPSSAPGMLDRQAQGGLYAGATSAALHLLSGDPNRVDDSESRPQSQERAGLDFPTLTNDYDRDLLGMLPTLDIIDGLINYYFEYCNWIYRHINQESFLQHWQRYKGGTSADRITLSTCCAILAAATFYLPSQHHLLEGFTETPEAMGQKFHEASTMALQRRQSETKAYNLELLELTLIRSHYLTLLKKDSEEIWAAAGDLVRIGTAMGLHRDPGKWRMHRDVAERRRWAWWHIILFERWQAFMLGRPTAIAAHHWDTQLPSYCDPAIDKSGRLYLPNLALFRLAYILGDILDDAVSVRPVPYENVLANDRSLTQWMDNLPAELDLDEYRLARNLASPNANLRRLGVQSVIIRSSYYHIRFTLHRPYASAAANSAAKASSSDPPKTAQSLEIAVNAADKLIAMIGQSRPDFLANTAQALPGHLNWGPSHCFSAAMFFSFQLIANPDQPGANLFRASIAKAITTLELSRGMTVADKAYDILTALAPLYSPDFSLQTPESREKQRSEILSVVRKLAFPYHTSDDPRRFADSPAGRGSGTSPANSNSLSPPLTLSAPTAHYDSLQTHTMSAVRTPTYAGGAGSTQTSHLQQLPHSPQQMSAVTTHPSQPYSAPSYTDFPRYQQYMHPLDDSTMWGAAVGFEHGEWTQFLDGLRPDASSRHLPGS